MYGLDGQWLVLITHKDYNGFILTTNVTLSARLLSFDVVGYNHSSGASNMTECKDK